MQNKTFKKDKKYIKNILKKYSDNYFIYSQNPPKEIMYKFVLNSKQYYITYYMNYIHSENNPLKKLFSNKKNDSNIISLKPNKHLLEIEICGKNTKVYLGLEELEDWFIENK